VAFGLKCSIPNQEDRAHVRKRLKFSGIGIETPSEGVVNAVVDGVKAVINAEQLDAEQLDAEQLDAEQLDELKRHTRRGMRGGVQEGRSAGGRSYGL
jgi:site-specific DNA recombinase